MNPPARGIKKRCPACDREFVGTFVVCSHDGTLLVPVRETLVGKILANKYEVLEEIGRGGMSVVYKGIQRMVDRTVAIKMLQSQLLNDPTSIMRFQREAQAVACIAHPNVITVYDCDIHEGQPYLVMDYLVGESLSAIIKRDNHLPVDRVIKIFERVTDALEHAHQKGVLHRDLKSSNIMLVVGDGQKEVVKVVDFGIAKILPSSGKQAQNLTATGEIFGSPIYMSPEQCQGLPLDKGSDIYSTGVMMYEALTGEPPLLGENIVDTMQMHVTTNPVPFSQIRPDLQIPQAVEAIVLKSLEKNPLDRFQSMLDFKEALEYLEKTLDSGVAVEQQAPMRTGSKSPHTTRQGMTGSRAPSQMPKPSLDTGEHRLSSARNPKVDLPRPSAMPIPDPRSASQRIAKLDSAKQPAPRDSSLEKPRKREADVNVNPFKVDDVEVLEDSHRKRKIILFSLSFVFVLISVVGIAVYFATQH